MSASQDKTQKVAFVYSNLYQIYRKGKAEAMAAGPAVSSPVAPGAAIDLESPFAVRARVIKSGDLSQGERLPIHTFTPTEFIAKRAGKALKAPEALKSPTNPALESLKHNLKSLNDLHSRLHFMLKELEDLANKS